MYTSKIVNGDETRPSNCSLYETVEDNKKVRQDVKMVLSTSVRDSNGLGASLQDAIGSDAENPEPMNMFTPFMLELQLRVNNSLLMLKNAQRQYQMSYRTVKEMIHEISHVRVWVGRGDPREYYWNVDILTIDERFNFTVNGRTRW